MLGDDFLQSSFGELQMLCENAKTDEGTVSPYLFEFYNVHDFHKLASIGMRSVMARILNTLMEVVNTRPRLPRFLVVILDTDLRAEFDILGETKIAKDFSKVLHYLAKQINIIIRRKGLLITEKKPGVVFGNHPVMIYVKVLHIVIYYPPSSRMGRLCANRLKFNEVLNDIAAEMGYLIMNITDCTLDHHFDNWGYLTKTGKRVFWQQLNNLLEQFDNKKIMLLPAPKKNQDFRAADRGNYYNGIGSGNSRHKLPPPSGYCY